MIPDNVTLIVKAPNQQIDDQNVECQSSWTVLQLKGHLSEVYPNKPRTDEQKIIYSGKLLDDHTVLKDILRTYESQITHTMHLVCTPKGRMSEPTAKAPERSTEGLRHRNVQSSASVASGTEPVEVPETPRPERQNDQNHTVEMQNYLSSYMNNYGRVPPYPHYSMGEGLPVPNDPVLFANQMMMMQQAYMQYMQQYANMWQPPPAPTAAPPTAAPPAPPAAPPVHDEDEPPRDWLEHLYAASRLALLCSLVYLYGSPARLLLVILLAAAGYLHQIGFFRDLQVNPQPEALRPERNAPAGNGDAQAGNRNAPAGNGNAQAGNGNHANIGIIGNADANVGNGNANIGNGNANIGNGNANIGNGNANIGNGNANVGNTENATVEQADNNQSLLAVTWMVFTTFFASLIPDTN